MCGRLVQDFSTAALAREFGTAEPAAGPVLPPTYNLPPSRPAYVVGFHPKARRRGLAPMTWGLVPRWWTGTLAAAPKPINATAEGVESKPTFRDSFRSRRCLVPVAGFYEWAKTGKTKVPHFVHPVGADLFALAGLWDYWPPERRHSFAVVTTTPNDLLASFHDRMPVIVPREAWADWLDPLTPLDAVRRLLAPLPAALMAARPVGPKVNSPRHDGPDLLSVAA